MISRAESSMSKRRDASRQIDRLDVGQDVLLQERISALLNTTTADEVNLPARDRLQLLGHLRITTPRPVHTWLMCEEHVDVAVRPEIVAQHGAEQGQLGDLPFAAERRDLLHQQIDTRAGGHVSSSGGTSG